MAPDKIYTDNRGVYAEIPVFSQSDANVEYIRKDALLEWAKEEGEGNVGATYKVAMRNLIQKLDSM